MAWHGRVLHAMAVSLRLAAWLPNPDTCAWNVFPPSQVGRDLYFRSFVAGISGFIVLLFSFDSIVGRSQDFVSSVQNNLLPGAWVQFAVTGLLSIFVDHALPVDGCTACGWVRVRTPPDKHMSTSNTDNSAVKH